MRDEVSRRYHVQYGQKPLLRLLSDGAILHLDDTLSDVFAGSTFGLQLVAEVDGWDIGKMDDRYESICRELKRVALANVAQGLASAQVCGVLSLQSGKCRRCNCSWQPREKSLRLKIGLRVVLTARRKRRTQIT